MPQITCPACAARYDMPAGAIRPEGRKVRCAACKTLWLAHIDPDSGIGPADTPGPDEGAAIAAVDHPQEEAHRPDAPSSPDRDERPADEVLPPQAAQSPPSGRKAPTLKAPARQRKPWHERLGERVDVPRARWQVAAALALVAGLAGIAGLRKSIVHHVPETGRVFAALGLPVNLTGLELKSVRSGVVTEGGVELLVLQGEIANVTATSKPVPRLKFAIRDARGLEIYTWTAQAEMKDLKPGESQSFRRRLASPPPEGADVLVRFAGKADLIALAR